MTIFNATLEAVTTNKSKTVVKLSLSNKEAAVFAQKYLASVDKELRVSFDDPQMEMDFEPTAGGRPGLVVTTDHNGVVETVKQQEVGDDDQADLFEQDVLSDRSGDDEGNSRDPDENDGNEPDDDDDGEVEFDDVETLDDYEPQDAEAPDAELIEEFILSEKPEFAEIPYNFAELLRRRREDDVRWIDLAKETGVTSNKLQTAYREYKQLVVKQMRQQGVA